MADVLQPAINDSRRVPNLVMAAHVHNYQRIEREVVRGSVTPFIVAGLGGYYHLHGMNASDGAVDDQTGARLVKSDAQHHGYVTLTIDAETISGVLTTVDTGAGGSDPSADTFHYPTAAQILPDGAVVSL